MLHRIPVDVIEAPLEIIFISDCVLPGTVLPDAALAVVRPILRAPSFAAARSEIISGEAFLDLPPAERVIVIVGRELPDGVQMIGQEDDGGNTEGSAGLLLLESVGEE